MIELKIVFLAEDTRGDNVFVKAEHGLSVYIETEKHKIIMDTGASDITWENATALGIDIEKVDTVVISHGHYDHTGGVLSLAEKNPGVDIYIQRRALGDYYEENNGEIIYIGIDHDIDLLSSLVSVEGDFKIDDELSLFSGIKERKFWPKSNLKMREKTDDGFIQDTFEHEQFLVINENGKRMMISGCAHNGILNLIDRFYEQYGSYPDTVISGFHMMKDGHYTLEEIESIKKAAEQLAVMDSVFYTGHCTGQPAYEIMKEIMGENLIRIHAGMEVTL